MLRVTILTLVLGCVASAAQPPQNADRSQSVAEANRISDQSLRLARAGKYDEALPLMEQVLAIRERVLGPEDVEVAKALNNIAELRRVKGDYATIDPLYARALAILTRALGPDDSSVGAVLNNMAILANRRSDFDAAEDLFERALRIKEKASGPESADAAGTMNNLAHVRLNKADFIGAADLFEQALRIREKLLGPDDPEVGQAVNNLGEVYEVRGEFDAAERMFRRALAVRERSLGAAHPDLASTLDNLADIRVHSGDLKEAEQLSRRALVIREKALGPVHPDVAVTLQSLGDIERTKGELAEADSLYRRALDIREKTFGRDHPEVAESMVGVASIHSARGEYGEAAALYAGALAIDEQAFGPRHPKVADVLNSLAIVYWASGDVNQAVAAQARAAAITEHYIDINVAAGSERQKLAYLATQSQGADRIISLHVRAAPGDLGARALAALTIVQRKGRVLDAMADSLTSLRERSGSEDRRLLEQFNAAMTQLAGLALRGPQGTPAAAYQQRIAALEQRREQLEAEISRRSAEFRAGTQGVTLDTVCAAIPADAALIEFAVYRPFDPKAVPDSAAYAEPRYVAYVLHHDGAIGWQDLGDVRRIDASLARFREALRDPARTDVDRLARNLDAAIMQPLRPLLGGATRLLVSPDGELNLIPFEALRDERGRYLIRGYSIVYLTSGRDLPRLQVARDSRSRPLIIANPQFGDVPARSASDDYFLPLGGTALEARAIHTVFPEATVLTGTQATKDALKSAPAPRLLHIATHGFFREGRDNPLLRSGLALAGANVRTAGGSPGILTALEASGLNLWGTELVTLSACDTGVGEVKNGEGVYGLRRALVLAGAKTLVMSLWPVGDSATQEMMTGYYRRLRQGLARDEALRRVKLAMLKRPRRQHPFYWASFIQSGEWDAIRP